MTEIPPQDESKLTRTKQVWAAAGKFLTGRHVRPEDERLPPGQHLVRDWPVLDLGVQPDVPTERWSLRIYGAVEQQVSLDWTGFLALPQQESVSDIHCVTTWSRYDNTWRGVMTRDLLDLVRPHGTAAFVILHSHDGYTTNLPLADFAAADALLATHWQGQPIAREHGGPMRLIVPHLYFWKSAKWLQRIEFVAADRAGYWEQRGYHMHGDPWTEQRYG
jgi:DMSO/TMAO reductase YedYZ molybdopterin-dependent catalytic subunit